MTTLEDRLRQDLPALADLLMEDQATQPQEAVQPEEAVDAIADGPSLVVEFGARPAHRRRRWPAVVAAAAAVAAVAGVAALLIDTSDGSKVTTTEAIAARQDGASETEAPGTLEGGPETPSGRIEVPDGEPQTLVDQTEAPNGQPQFPDEPRDGGTETSSELPDEPRAGDDR